MIFKNIIYKKIFSIYIMSTITGSGTLSYDSTNSSFSYDGTITNRNRKVYKTI